MPHRYGIFLKKTRHEYYACIGGKRRYLGTESAGIRNAERRYREIVAELESNKPPLPSDITVSKLCDLFLDSMKARLNRGEIRPRTLDAHVATCGWLVSQVGSRRVSQLRGFDFSQLADAFPSQWGLETRNGNTIRIRQVFKFGYENELIDQKKFGSLKSVPRGKLRDERQSKGARVWTQDQFHRMIDASTSTVEIALMHLGIHGFSIAEAGVLRWEHIDGGWLDHRRVKTGIRRLIVLSEACMESLRVASDGRSNGFVLLAPQGGRVDSLNFSPRFTKLRRKAGIDDITHAGLRRTFFTVASMCPNVSQQALKLAMGHVQGDIGGEHYLAGDDRGEIRRIVDFVSFWLENPQVIDEWTWYRTASPDLKDQAYHEMGEQLRKDYPILFGL